MDGFKLDVGQGGFDQQRGFDLVVVQEFLQRAKTFQHLVRWRWNVQGIAGACAAYPVLGAAEFAGLFLAATSFLHQHAMDFF